MRICLVNPFTIQEGTGIRLTNIGRVLYERGHDIVLISTKSRKSVPNLPFETIDLPPRSKNKRLNCVLSSLPKFLCLLKQKFDIVHSIKAIPYATLPSFVAGKLKTKRVVLDWDDWEGKERLGRFMPFPFKEIHTLFERWIPYRMDGIIVGTNFLKKYLINKGYRKPVGYLPNGINIKEFKKIRKIELPNNSITIVGNLSGISDLPYVLHSVKIAAKKVDLRLLVIGDGNRRREFERLSQDLGIEKNVNFLGWVDEYRKKQLLYSSDICLMPMVDNIQNRSRSPMKLTEYMALGCAIIANNVGEVKNILDDAGFLIDQKEESLASAIVNLLENDNLRKKLKRMARKRVKLFDWKILVKKFEPFYYEVVS